MGETQHVCNAVFVGMPIFTALDGESVTEGGEHVYVLMRAASSHSTNAIVVNEDGLTTVECLEFILNAKTKDNTLVAFGLNYDVNMLLRDVPRLELKKLWRYGSCYFKGYKLAWTPSKWFSVSHGKRTARVNETFGFFQCSFVKALETWGVGSPDSIAEMKDRRSQFVRADIGEMASYCAEECVLLVALMDTLELALRTAGLTPKYWYGAGAIAGALLNRMGVVAEHLHDSEFGPDIEVAIMHAYFGGRIESFRTGWAEDVVSFDIRSAYPYSALGLPSLRSEFTQTTNIEEYGVYLVEWDFTASPIMPFPYRSKNKSISYPSAGKGWYHTPEILSALRLLEAYPDVILQITDGYVLSDNGARPFYHSIAGYWSERLKVKDSNPGAYKAIKLGMNSLYGKLAQGASKGPHKPKFQSFYWAGYITSHTRARLIAVALDSGIPEDVIAFATDSVSFAGNPNIQEGDGLGDLERSFYPKFFIAQPGMYYCTTSGGEEIARTRGWFSREVEWEKVTEAFDRDGLDGSWSAPVTRFCGLGSALMRKDFSVWRTWAKSDRRMGLHPSSKFPGAEFPSYTTLRPPRAPSDIMGSPLISVVYKPKNNVLDGANVESVQGMESQHILE